MLSSWLLIAKIKFWVSCQHITMGIYFLFRRACILWRNKTSGVLRENRCSITFPYNQILKISITPTSVLFHNGPVKKRLIFISWWNPFCVSWKAASQAVVWSKCWESQRGSEGDGLLSLTASLSLTYREWEECKPMRKIITQTEYGTDSHGCLRCVRLFCHPQLWNERQSTGQGGGLSFHQRQIMSHVLQLHTVHILWTNSQKRPRLYIINTSQIN